jgi:hypothetical protein
MSGDDCDFFQHYFLGISRSLFLVLLDDRRHPRKLYRSQRVIGQSMKKVARAEIIGSLRDKVQSDEPNESSVSLGRSLWLFVSVSMSYAKVQNKWMCFLLYGLPPWPVPVASSSKSEDPDGFHAINLCTESYGAFRILV